MSKKETRFRDGELTKSWKAILKKRDDWLVVKKHRITIVWQDVYNGGEPIQYIFEEWIPTPFLGWLIGTLVGIIINVLIGLITIRLQR